MSEILREQAQWRKAKSPIISKYATNHAKLFAEIAGRGFLILPGYAYDSENDLELTAKMGLSELNFKILSETIDRELKQFGLDYGLAYKNAMMTWEIEKQELMTTWDSEFATLKQNMAGAEDVLNLLAIEVSKRSITLIEGKTALELDVEAYRKTLAELDGTTAPYEVQLANAKLLTAQKKLTLLPILQEIITKEQELLTTEQDKVAAYTDYMVAEQELAIKKQALAPVVNELATKVKTYADKITSDQIPTEALIANERITQSGLVVEKAGHHVKELTLEIATAHKNLDLMDEKRTLQDILFDNEQSLVGTEIILGTDYRDAKQTQFDQLLQAERDAVSQIIDEKKTVHTTQSDMRKLSAQTIQSAARFSDYWINRAEIDEIKRKAIIDAATKITATLTHLIGS